MVYSNQDRTQDANLILKDAGAVTADGVATVASATVTLDVGAARYNGDLVIDVTAIDVSSNDEGYLVKVIGSNSSTFASGIVVLSTTALGDTVALGAGADTDNGVGRYVTPFHNQKDGTEYRYIRLYTDVSGTTPSINYTAYVSQRH